MRATVHDPVRHRLHPCPRRGAVDMRLQGRERGAVAVAVGTGRGQGLRGLAGQSQLQGAAGLQPVDLATRQRLRRLVTGAARVERELERGRAAVDDQHRVEGGGVAHVCAPVQADGSTGQGWRMGTWVMKS